MHNLAKDDWSSQDRVERMVKRYPISYHEVFWTTLERLVGSQPRDTVADFGCGPGLLLVDLVKKFHAKNVYGLDESENMLKQAASFLSEILPDEQYTLKQINFDDSKIDLDQNILDFGFAGHMFHEVVDPVSLSTQVFKALRPSGKFVVLDYVSGNLEGFVKSMVASGMDEEHVRARYPHMCKNSVDDLIGFLSKAGFSDITFEKIDEESRAIVVGIKR